VKRLIALVLLAGLVAGACAGQVAGAGATDSGIRGRAVAGPTCPVERADSPCPDRPLVATIVVTDPSGKQVKQARSGADGRFEITLEPGTYRVEGDSSTSMQRSTPPITVTVHRWQFTTVTIQFDTGIR